ncbi:hypothetical protein BGZ52_009791 [Haplosporangium bisporale]|nr:hypothetical protein BGZ52_009791 [Haplosporangium bisporale]KAI9237880.1 MAG: hypothetical protein BYD32DRAFT_415374 [Podila humilis]KFH74014.1 hypothetical protein MVEG_01227 [Podila verticillata NRRL 6337]
MTTLAPQTRSTVLAGILILILCQVTFLFRTSLQTVFHTAWSSSSSLANSGFFSTAKDPAHNRHPSVPISLADYAVLDDLAKTIVAVETHRVFEERDVGRIHGTAIKNDSTLVNTIRDQIHCWTTHGSWVRLAEKEVKMAQHLGDSRFGKCNERFMQGLEKRIEKELEDRQGGQGGEERFKQHFLGEYNEKDDQMLVREATKYRWVPDETICGPRPATTPSKTPSSSSSTPEGETGQGTIRMGFGDARSKYESFTRKDFCRVLGRRNMLLVGDVTQYQLHDVITSAFGYNYACHGELGCLHRSPHQLCVGTDPATGQSRVDAGLKYARNDIISVPWAINPEDEEYPSASTIEQTWATPELLKQYPVVILNKGLVWREDEAFLTELVFTMKHLWKFYPGTLVIYRATHPVSSKCMQMKEDGEDEAIADKTAQFSVVPETVLQKPLTSAPKREEHRRRHHRGAKEEGENDEQGYVFRPTLPDVQRQNQLAKAVVEAAGGIFLDTEAMFAMRPDGRMGDHGDCSRYCAPGPLDAYVDLLHNTFRILQV